MKGFAASVWGGRRFWLWVPPLVFLLANLTAFLIYQAIFADEAAVVQSRLSDAQAQLEELEEQRDLLEGYLRRVEGTRQGLTQIYSAQLAPEEDRLTAILREVRHLARQANLEPQSTTYPKEELEDYGLARRSFVFTVQGTYFDLRKLINSLELSEYFLTLEDVALSEVGGGRAGGQLTISLRLSTLFAEPGSTLPGGTSARSRSRTGSTASTLRPGPEADDSEGGAS